MTDMYEPGSVMKAVTMSAGIEERLVNPDTTFEDTGVAMIDGVPITKLGLRRSWHGVDDAGADQFLQYRRSMGEPALLGRKVLS